MHPELHDIFLESAAETDLAPHASFLFHHLKPAIAFEAAEPDEDLPLFSTRMGGLPELAEGAVWPTFEGRTLAFLAQFNLQDLKPFDLEGVLPEKGLLSFFADTSGHIFGHEETDIGAVAVIYTPEGPVTELASPDEALELLPCVLLSLSLTYTLPSPGEGTPEDFSDAVSEEEDAEEAEEAYYALADHEHPHQNRLLGLEALNSNSISSWASQAFPDVQGPWRPLLTWFEVYGVDWGDSKLVIGISEQDLQNRDFSRVWGVLGN